MCCSWQLAVVRYDSFVTGLVCNGRCICDVTHLWHVSSAVHVSIATWFIREMTHPGHDSFVTHSWQLSHLRYDSIVTCLTIHVTVATWFIRGMTHSWINWFVTTDWLAIRLIRDMFYLLHVSFATWIICGMSHSWHASFVTTDWFATWLIHDMFHLLQVSFATCMTHSWHASFVCALRPTFSFIIGANPFVTRLIRVCSMTHPHFLV